jgi:hypothetical protein
MPRTTYHIGRLSEEEEWKLNFKDGLSRSISERIALGFAPMKLPVIDDQPYRVFETMKEYREWAAKNLPAWLGYGPADD